MAHCRGGCSGLLLPINVNETRRPRPRPGTAPFLGKQGPTTQTGSDTTSPHNFITPLWGRIYYVLDTALLCKIHIEFGRLLAPGHGGGGSIRTFGDAAAADDDFGVDCSSDGEEVKEGFVVQYSL